MIAIKPYYQDDTLTIYNEDCRNIPHIKADLLLSDPPYGVDNDCDYTRFTNGLHDNHNFHKGIPGDSEPFDPTPWLSYKKVVLWGANYYANKLPMGTWLVWLKKRDNQLGTFLSDCEIAFQKGGKGVFLYRHFWHGFDRASERGYAMVH